MRSRWIIWYPISILLFITVSVQLLAGKPFHSGDTLFIGYGTTPTINGTLSPGEWDDALSIVLSEPGGSPGDATLYLKHDTANLYAAFENTNVNYWVWWILIDTQNDGGGAPQTDDYKLIGPGFMVEYNGNGSGWVEVSSTGWTSMGDEFSSESSISYGKLGITPGAAKTVGIAFCYGGGMPWENIWPPDLDTWNDEVVPNTWGDIVSNDDWGATGIGDEGIHRTVPSFHVAPNPCSGRVRFSICLTTPSHSLLQIHASDGRLVRTLIDGSLCAGRYTAGWDGMDQKGGAVSSGIYFARLTTKDGILIRRITVIK